MSDNLAKVKYAITAQDFAAFDTAFHGTVAPASAYHDQWDKGFIVWSSRTHHLQTST